MHGDGRVDEGGSEEGREEQDDGAVGMGAGVGVGGGGRGGVESVGQGCKC